MLQETGSATRWFTYWSRLEGKHSSLRFPGRRPWANGDFLVSEENGKDGIHVPASFALDPESFTDEVFRQYSQHVFDDDMVFVSGVFFEACVGTDKDHSPITAIFYVYLSFLPGDAVD